MGTGSWTMICQRGVGTVVSAGMCLALMSVCTAATIVALWFAGVSDTQDAADAAALAGAAAALEGAEPCPAAAEAARLNGAEVQACEFFEQGGGVAVEVSVVADLKPVVWGIAPTVTRFATAGT